MLSCKEISRLFSESLDHKLTLRQRMSMWMHLQLCRLCSGFAKNLVFLRQASRRRAEEIERDARQGTEALSAEARERIRRAMEG